MKKMAESGLYDIVAHPDLIKIFSVNEFHDWLARPDSMELVRDALRAARDAGMAMEISSAGLRKPLSGNLSLRRNRQGGSRSAPACQFRLGRTLRQHHRRRL